MSTYQIHSGNAKIDVSRGADLILLRDIIRIVSGIIIGDNPQLCVNLKKV